MNNTPRSLWVFHRGALGDCVLLWPALRSAARAGWAVTLITDASKGRLAASELPISAVDIEQPRFNALWQVGAAPESHEQPEQVICAVAGNDAAGRLWLTNARRMFPAASLIHVPDRVTRVVAEELATKLGGECPVPVRENRDGPIVVHPGAGAPHKRWPIARFSELTRRLERGGHACRWIAGEVEAERFTPVERDQFQAHRAGMMTSLDDLATELRSARLFVGNDSGPTHLAAQLGIRTVALFGPTDPTLWAPAGPRVRVLAPAAATDTAWLSVEVVANEVSTML